MMTDDPLQTSRDSKLDRSDVRQLASHVLSVLAAQAKSRIGTRNRKRLTDFCNALIHPDERRRYDVVASMIAAGISTEEIIETYVPEAARQLGEDWIDDKLSFAEVSVGAARLQEIVRAFGNPYERPGALVPLGRSILMIVPDIEKHTLGPFIAASQFRRYGLWVQMAIGMTPGEVGDLVMENRFSMVGISCGNRRAVAHLAKLVHEVQCRVEVPAPVVIGGSIVSEEPDLKEMSGADLVTQNPREALDYCRLGPVATDVLAIDGMSGTVGESS